VPPHALVVMLDREFSGLLGGLMSDELSRVRMGASLALGRAGMLKDKERAKRMQPAIEALVAPKEGDVYCPVIGMLPSVRGTGYIPELFELCRQHARDRGARRVVFQASEDMPGLVRMYERTDHYRIGEGKASDPESGCQLHYIHFAINL
jgi:GNAT superfamily N-acetyltransferase